MVGGVAVGRGGGQISNHVEREREREAGEKPVTVRGKRETDWDGARE